MSKMEKVYLKIKTDPILSTFNFGMENSSELSIFTSHIYAEVTENFRPILFSNLCFVFWVKFVAILHQHPKIGHWVACSWVI